MRLLLCLSGRLPETPGVHTIPPGQSHDIFADFKVEDTVPQVALQMTGVTVDGQPLALPDYVVVAQRNQVTASPSASRRWCGWWR